MNKKKKKIKVALLITISNIILLISFVILYLRYIDARTFYDAEYFVDRDLAKENSIESANLLSSQEKELLDRILYVYWEENEDKELYAIYGEPENMASNHTFFGNIYEYGFGIPETFLLNKTIIGTKFVKDEMHLPEDAKPGPYKKHHIEYGICYIYDEYIDNLPEYEEYSDKMDLYYLEHLHGNLYAYAVCIYR